MGKSGPPKMEETEVMSRVGKIFSMVDLPMWRTYYDCFGVLDYFKKDIPSLIKTFRLMETLAISEGVAVRGVLTPEDLLEIVPKIATEVEKLAEAKGASKTFRNFHQKLDEISDGLETERSFISYRRPANWGDKAFIPWESEIGQIHRKIYSKLNQKQVETILSSGRKSKKEVLELFRKNVGPGGSVLDIENFEEEGGR